MKKSVIIVLVLLSWLTVSCKKESASETSQGTTPGTVEYVHICTGAKSVTYHRMVDCIGLTNCSQEIEKVTLEEAKDMNRRACEICYGK
jgi:hypothetical protein